MKPVKMKDSNHTFHLSGGTEENDLPCRRDFEGERRHAVTYSAWELTPEERKAVADGAHIRMTWWGHGHAPVALDLYPPDAVDAPVEEVV